MLPGLYIMLQREGEGELSAFIHFPAHAETKSVTEIYAKNVQVRNG